MNKSRVMPFGYMADSFNEVAASHALPTAWRGTPAEFDAWLDKRMRDIRDAAWPEWNRATREWEGKAEKTGIDLTKADLGLMMNLANAHYDPSRQDTELNNWWFWKEDELFKDDFGVERFDRVLGADVLNQRRAKSFTDGGSDKFAGSVGWLLKDRLQRPRAHQMAYWLGLKRPNYKLAWSAWSASAISGHSFQGLLACLKVYLDGLPWTAEQEKKLLELAVDIGDRRVFAGVHYPSDNALSWSVALHLVDYIGADKAQESLMRQFIVNAIQTSRVYTAMQSSPVHASCLGLLSPWVTVSAKRGPVKPGNKGVALAPRNAGNAVRKVRGERR